jgi:large subunit ribosomal protein L17
VRQWLPDRELVRKVFEEISPRFLERPGGYLRIVKLGSRQGDGAEMAILEFVERSEVEVEAPKSKKEPKEKKSKQPEATVADEE